jgi:transposase InsO family protein
MLEGFPFVVRGFHSDNGSEYINGDVAKLLNKLKAEFTKSRPRHSNDNALAECKNGVVIRKLMGYSHITQHRAKFINLLFKNSLNPYLNFHRPCFFTKDTINAKGKVTKTYPHELIMTPWDKLQTIPSFEQYLKLGLSTDSLQQQASELPDSQAADQFQKARKLLFQSLNSRSKDTP